MLNQRQLSAQNFDTVRLNNPNFINNFQSQLTFDQVFYDSSSTKARIHSAGFHTQIASEDGRRAQMGVIASVAGAYFGAVLAKDRLAVAQEAVHSAEADLRRAETVRAAGMSTDADVLSVRVPRRDE